MSFEEHILANFEDDKANIILKKNDCNSTNSIDRLYSSDNSVGIKCNASQRLNNSGTSDDDDKQLSVNESNWAELPSLIVKHIYSFLSRCDQYRMSLVCSRWAKALESPYLWKIMKFYLSESDYPFRNFYSIEISS
ncbi:hypothetical protein AVEN_114763-1 [Araneus ventricosus]|uniref:F-box domain-containing protein n=1 Tax=Araneus ventricosus TaxID=182803 RepID=A0A4Y2NBT9_ARAVE|nr:hypothetical protein AVEN_114763-1 [Araneus ventricosus]